MLFIVSGSATGILLMMLALVHPVLIVPGLIVLFVVSSWFGETPAQRVASEKRAAEDHQRRLAEIEQQERLRREQSLAEATTQYAYNVRFFSEMPKEKRDGLFAEKPWLVKTMTGYEQQLGMPHHQFD